jgi:hypothetical protein
MILWELVVVKITALCVVLAADIDDSHGRIVEVGGRGLAPQNRRLVDGDKKAAREELVLMRAARMGQNF